MLFDGLPSGWCSAALLAPENERRGRRACERRGVRHGDERRREAQKPARQERLERQQRAQGGACEAAQGARLDEGADVDCGHAYAVRNVREHGACAGRRHRREEEAQVVSGGC